MYRPAYLPPSFAEIDVWYKNFVAKISQYAATLSITPAELASFAADSAMISFAVTQSDIAEKESEKRNEYRLKLLYGKIGDVLSAYPVYITPPIAPTAVPAAALKRLSKFVTKIINTATYNDTIGRDLGIIAVKSAATLSSSTDKPTFTLSLEINHPVIKWKKGKIEGIDIYVDRNDGLGFVLLYGCNRAKFVDMTPLPSVVTTWTYKIAYRKGVQQFGVLSDPSSIAVVDGFAAMNGGKPAA